MTDNLKSKLINVIQEVKAETGKDFDEWYVSLTKDYDLANLQPNEELISLVREME